VPTGMEHVYLQLDLDEKFQLSSIVLDFRVSMQQCSSQGVVGGWALLAPGGSKIDGDP